MRICQKTRNKILNNLLLDIEKQSQAQSVGRVELLNLLIEKAQASWKDDDEIVVKKKRSLSKDILKDDACALMLNLNLSVNQFGDNFYPQLNFRAKFNKLNLKKDH